MGAGGASRASPASPVPVVRARVPRIVHMHDLPPDLPRLRTLEIWLDHTLGRVRTRIAELEAEAVRTPPPPPQTPDWEISGGRAGQEAVVHVGGCGMAGKARRPIGRDQALGALADGVTLACPICQPDTELGLL